MSSSSSSDSGSDEDESISTIIGILLRLVNTFFAVVDFLVALAFDFPVVFDFDFVAFVSADFDDIQPPSSAKARGLTLDFLDSVCFPFIIFGKLILARGFDDARNGGPFGPSTKYTIVSYGVYVNFGWSTSSSNK
jgi:hypothetical protein